ncbi:hypothetical protein SAMN05660742_11471 [Propionispira arboris]|uniref:Histidine kinase-, DNA gyrase B-, and HSP90-like ATPase n=2 Tax=Propionispira TaxID=84034 RepID=A0A1H7AYI6_9FIRM|nr:hypothetical protein SAMN05660742_11471 [Propionispira arboris]
MEYVIDLYDNGAGLPDDFEPRNSKSLGLQIVRTLIEDDMSGTFELYNDHGTHAKITVPSSLGGGK